MYANDTIKLHQDCFGPKYVTKLNELKAMIESDWQEHLLLEISVVYQMYFMWSDKCTVDDLLNDVFTFCWVNDCTSTSQWNNTKLHFLKMLRSLNDAGIVFFEGIPKNDN